MQVLIRRDDFSAASYDLQVGAQGLVFAGTDNSFVLPYPEVRDFCITRDRRDKTYFSALGIGEMTEGQILDTKEIDAFMAALKEMLGGIMNIEVRKN